MTEITWAAVIGCILLLSQILNIYNSSKTARKNANEPIEKVKDSIHDLNDKVQLMEFKMENMAHDLDRAHDKIRENESTFIETTKAQNKALLAILLWIKDPNHGDAKQIDEAIKGISV